MQAALDHRGIDDTIEEVGQFPPRGMAGSMFAGAMIGDDVDSAKQLLVGASDSMVYGFEMHSRQKEPDDLASSATATGEGGGDLSGGVPRALEHHGDETKREQRQPEHDRRGGADVRPDDLAHR